MLSASFRSNGYDSVLAIGRNSNRNNSNSNSIGNSNGNSNGYRNHNHSSDDDTFSDHSGSRKRRTPLSFLGGSRSGYRSGSDTESYYTTASSNHDDCFVSDHERDANNDETETAKAKSSSSSSTIAGNVDELLSQELLKMSLVDRTDIQEEIHGVACLSLDETPELLKRSLQEFKRELGSLSPSKKQTYEKILACRKREQRAPQSHARRKHYAIDDEDFRLRFLRAELFDTKKAVMRFVNYLEFVNELWGFPIASTRQIRLTDFSKEELKFLKQGYFQLLPFRDRSGRRVVVILGENGGNNGTKKKNISYDTDPTTKAKCYFYMWDVASRDSIESQRNGVVAIAHPNGICFDLQNHELYLVHRLSVSVPTRMVVSHNFCHDFSGYKLLAKVVVAHVVSGSKHKQIIRQKFHVGLNDTEIRYYLQGFGIPIQFFPLTETGTIKLNYFNKWIKTRSFLEAKANSKANNSAHGGIVSKKKKNSKPVVVVECPLLNDVVFRQGKPYKANPGNDVLRDSILEELKRKMIATTQSNNKSTPKNSSTNNNQIKTNGCYKVEEEYKSDAGDCNNENSSSGTDISTDHFCNWLVDEIQINRKGRFLTWDSGLSSWVQMEDKMKIRRKISVSLYNYEKRHSAALERMQKDLVGAIAGAATTAATTTTSSSSSLLSSPPSLFSSAAPTAETSISSDLYDSFFSPTGPPLDGENEDLAYTFIEGGRQSSSQFCCSMGGGKSKKSNDNTEISGDRKRSRDSFLSDMAFVNPFL